MSIPLKVLCYAALMGIWGLFAYLRLTPVEGFIGAVTAALAALGAIHSGAPAAPPVPQPTKESP
jgi:hypothetical protein